MLPDENFKSICGWTVYKAPKAQEAWASLGSHNASPHPVPQALGMFVHPWFYFFPLHYVALLQLTLMPLYSSASLGFSFHCIYMAHGMGRYPLQYVPCKCSLVVNNGISTASVCGPLSPDSHWKRYFLHLPSHPSHPCCQFLLDYHTCLALKIPGLLTTWNSTLLAKSP